MPVHTLILCRSAAPATSTIVEMQSRTDRPNDVVMACEYGEETDFQSFWQDVIDKTNHQASQPTSQAPSQPSVQAASQPGSTADQSQATPGQQEPVESQGFTAADVYKLIDVYKFAGVLNAIQVVEKVSLKIETRLLIMNTYPGFLAMLNHERL